MSRPVMQVRRNCFKTSEQSEASIVDVITGKRVISAAALNTNIRQAQGQSHERLSKATPPSARP